VSDLNVLHVTAHLGGGVGKVLSRLVEESARTQDRVRHTIAMLEAPEKSQFVEHVQAHGGTVLVCPSLDTLNQLAADTDIVQLEWWHHPAIAAWLCSGNLPPMRLIVWAHISGLHPPLIPPDFVRSPHRFLFTSPCSLEHPALLALVQAEPTMRSRMDTVFSSGGFDDLPVPSQRPTRKTLRAGYVGTLNFAKLHPHLLTYLAAVTLPDFRLVLVGDPTTSKELQAQAAALGIAHRLDLRGYCNDIAEVLADLDVCVYLLNPLHYGTTENALLEAMAMGVVPVVLDNPAERHLVRNEETGFRITTPESFADALNWLAEHPEERRRISANAVADIRDRFSGSRTHRALNRHYAAVAPENKRPFDFRAVFGHHPADWFRACQGEETWRFPDDMPNNAPPLPPGPHHLYENTKGSVFHYHRTFPSDPRLARWASNLKKAQSS
jgi:L-malate glycosyltransferase